MMTKADLLEDKVLENANFLLSTRFAHSGGVQSPEVKATTAALVEQIARLEERIRDLERIVIPDDDD